LFACISEESSGECEIIKVVIVAKFDFHTNTEIIITVFNRQKIKRSKR
jgi:hypothetical protein